MKKLALLLTGSILSASLLAGCNTNNDINNPPRPKVNDVDDNNRINDYRNDPMNDNLNDRNNNINDNIRDNNLDNDLNDNHYSPREDKNTDTDKDPVKDSNTKKEEIIEDDIDVNDRDNKDE